MAQSYYPNEDTYLNIARGLVKGTSSVHKFGAVPAMSQSTTGSIWDVNDTIYPWSAFDTANSVVVSANTNDNGKVLTIVGLDSNYDPLSETVTISAGAATTTNQFKRVFRAYTTSETNANNINMSVNSTTVARITQGIGQTLMAVYTVPNGYNGYLKKGVMSAQFGADATGNMYVRYGGETAFRVGHSFEVNGAGGQYNYDFAVPVVIPQKSDIDVRATVRTNNGRYTAAFDIILIKSGLV
jgi:hypothetical protein